METEFQVVAEDGCALKGVIHCGEEPPKSIVIINPATAIKTQYYYPFSKFLVENGYAVVTWNYRGFCESKSKPLQDSIDSFSDFGTKDIPAVLGFIKARYADVPIIGVGHSVGGQQIGLVKNNHIYSGFVAVAASSGYLKNMPLHYRLQSIFFFFFYGPLSIFLKKYVICKKLNIMEDLPRNVFYEWRRWCTKEKYLFDKDFLGASIPQGNYQNLPFPIHVITATDDEVATHKNMKSFWDNVNSIDGIKFKTINPVDFGQKKIGHLGYFGRRFQSSAWLEIIDSINKLSLH